MKNLNLIKYNQIIFKASHNSYDRSESISEQLKYNSEEPWQGGCLGLEFDLWRHSSPYEYKKDISEDYFSVHHTSPSFGKNLSHWLKNILSWHQENPDHLPVLITLDIKSSNGGYNKFHDELDTYLFKYFEETLIFKPGNLVKENTKTDLCNFVIDNGWPSLEEMKGKFIFCLSGNKTWKAQYAQYNLLTERYSFSDFDVSDDDKELMAPDYGPFVFFNFHIWNKNTEIWMNIIKQFTEKNLLTRAYKANDKTIWNNAVKAGFSAIATDKIKNHEWATVGGKGDPFKIK